MDVFLFAGLECLVLFLFIVKIDSGVSCGRSTVRFQRGGYPASSGFGEFSLCAWIGFCKRQGKWFMVEVRSERWLIGNQDLSVVSFQGIWGYQFR